MEFLPIFAIAAFLLGLEFLGAGIAFLLADDDDELVQSKEVVE